MVVDEQGRAYLPADEYAEMQKLAQAQQAEIERLTALNPQPPERQPL